MDPSAAEDVEPTKAIDGPNETARACVPPREARDRSPPPVDYQRNICSQRRKRTKLQQQQKKKSVDSKEGMGGGRRNSRHGSNNSNSSSGKNKSRSRDNRRRGGSSSSSVNIRSGLFVEGGFLSDWQLSTPPAPSRGPFSLLLHVRSP